MDNAKTKPFLVVQPLPTTVPHKTMHVLNTAVAQALMFVVKKEKYVSHLVFSAALGIKRSAMETVFLTMHTAALLEPHTVITQKNVQKTAVMR